MRIKSTDEIAEDFNRNEKIRLSVTRSATLKKGQAKGNITRNRTRSVNRIFKNKYDRGIK